jgi:proteic killer suppression protein
MQRSCSDQRYGRKEFGKLWPLVARRLNELRACVVLADMLVGNLHPLVGNRPGQFSVHLTANCRLVFECADEPVPCLPDGSVDKREVTAITILEVTDYHA